MREKADSNDGEKTCDDLEAYLYQGGRYSAKAPFPVDIKREFG